MIQDLLEKCLTLYHPGQRFTWWARKHDLLSESNEAFKGYEENLKKTQDAWRGSPKRVIWEAVRTTHLPETHQISLNARMHDIFKKETSLANFWGYEGINLLFLKLSNISNKPSIYPAFPTQTAFQGNQMVVGRFFFMAIHEKGVTQLEYCPFATRKEFLSPHNDHQWLLTWKEKHLDTFEVG